MKSEPLWHSAQHLNNLYPDIISKGKDKLDLLEKKAVRQQIASQMDDVTSAGREISSSPKVIVYYKQADFVIKTTPEDRDCYNRLAPILSYGKFPDGDLNSYEEDQWIESIRSEIIEFVSSIERGLSSETKEEIIEVLKILSRKKRTEKVISPLLENLLLYGTVAIVPLALGWLVHDQIPQMIQPLFQQKPQQILTVPLQEVLQKLVWLLAILVSISNVVMMFMLRLPIVSIVNGYKRKKDR